MHGASVMAHSNEQQTWRSTMTDRAARRREDRETRKKVIDAGQKALMDDLVERAVQAAAEAEGVTYEEMDVLTDAENIVAEAAGDTPATPAAALLEMSLTMIEMIIPDRADTMKMALDEHARHNKEGDVSTLVDTVLQGSMVRSAPLMEMSLKGKIPSAFADFFYVSALVALAAQAQEASDE